MCVSNSTSTSIAHAGKSQSTGVNNVDRRFNVDRRSDANHTRQPETASQWLKQGQLLAYPTESVWGIGCDAMNQQAVRRILTIKNRPIDKGMIVVTDSIARIAPLLATLNKAQQQAINDSWQVTASKQATTWLIPLPKHIYIPNWITGQHSSLAIRVIAHPLIKQLCAHMVSANNPFGLVISTSCNPAGEPPANSIEQAWQYFANQIHYLPAETLGYQLPSQIKDAVSGSIIR